MPRLHTELKSVYLDFLSCFMREDYWKHCLIRSIDPTSQSEMLPLKICSICMGTQVAVKLSMEEYHKRPQDIEYFLKRVNDYFVEAASQIKHRFPLDDTLLPMLKILDPSYSNETLPSLAPLATRFPNLVAPDQFQEIDDEWRLNMEL